MSKFKEGLKFFRNGLPKHYAVVASMMVSCIGGAVVKFVVCDPEWSNPLIFFMVWILTLKMFHNPTLDKPDDLYKYRNVAGKSFIDEQDMIDYLNDEGCKGWSVVGMRPVPDKDQTFDFIFRRKFYSEVFTCPLKEDCQ